MKTDAPLKSRHLEILNAIVRLYIETGEPVGSRTLSRRRGNSLSPASIRNVMADLADEGYLSQPHTSAGRIPTEKAFRYYAGSLTASRITGADCERLCHEFADRDSLTARHIYGCFVVSAELVAPFRRAGSNRGTERDAFRVPAQVGFGEDDKLRTTFRRFATERFQFAESAAGVEQSRASLHNCDCERIQALIVAASR